MGVPRGSEQQKGQWYWPTGYTYLTREGSILYTPSTDHSWREPCSQGFPDSSFWLLAVWPGLLGFQILISCRIQPCNLNGYYYIQLTTTAKQRAGMRQMNAGRLPCKKQSTIITKVRTMWLLARLWTTWIVCGGAEGWFTTTTFCRGLTRK